MRITARSYEQLRDLANKHNVDAVFWWTPDNVIIGIQAFMRGGRIMVECGLPEKPESFHSDFPHAIQNTSSALFNVDG